MSASLVIRGGTVYDGTGAAGRSADLALDGDRVSGIGELPETLDADVLDATGLAVVPGFVNILSHAWGSLQLDPTGASDLLQGVTTEVFGEAFSLGPTPPGVHEVISQFGFDEGITVEFDRLSDGLGYLVSRGVAPNVASFVGGHNLRMLGTGFADGPMPADGLDRVRGILDEEMADGALGVGTALIYPPGCFADTDELVALGEVIGRHGGVYISHLRSEGDHFLECLDELIEIGRRSGCHAEAYHLKAAGRHNWPKMAHAIDRIEHARQRGQSVAANMYPYTAGGTALSASIPPPFHVGGPEALAERLADPAQRQAMADGVRTPSPEWENLFLAAGGGAGVLFFADLADGTPTRGRTLADLAADWGMDDADALVEAVHRDPHQGVAYFIIDEDNVRLGLSQPWVSVGSDAPAHRAVAPFVERSTHPRAYGTFARVLGTYVREQTVAPFTEMIRRMTSLPADTLGLRDRGRLAEGAFADVVVLDPATVGDRSTYDDLHRYAVGVRHVVVNGVPVVRDGELTGATPGRHLRRGG